VYCQGAAGVVSWQEIIRHRAGEEKTMKNPVESDDLKDLNEKQLDTLEKIIRRELHNLDQARERLDKALDNIRQERQQRGRT
jgi:hypothetical protein